MKKLGSEALLLLTAIIWGFAFVAQRKGMESLDPMLFNGIRFALGALVVGLFIKKPKHPVAPFSKRLKADSASMPFPWMLSIALFIAASLQQIGLVWTTAGSAGFITGLYVVFVPIIGIFRKQHISKTILIAIILSVTGLYFINSQQAISASSGNFLVLIGAVFFAWHVQLIDKHTKDNDTMTLAFYQYCFVALASLLAAFVWNFFKTPGTCFAGFPCYSVRQALLPILYTGILSVGVAYTLQVHAQKKVPPAAATVILCLEGAFGMLGGWLILKEQLTFSILLGAALLFAAMLVSIYSKFSK